MNAVEVYTNGSASTHEHDTRQKILDSAEQLFAERGFSATSLRAITASAGVNLAAVNYHFHSKENLILEVLSRGFRAVNAKRLELLTQYEQDAQTKGATATLERILHAFFIPAFQFFQDSHKSAFVRLIGRIHYESQEFFQLFIEKEFKGIIQRFTEATRLAVPHLSEEELFWGLHFSLGAMVHTLIKQHDLVLLSGSKVDASNLDETVEMLVRFCAAGIRSGGGGSQ